MLHTHRPYAATDCHGFEPGQKPALEKLNLRQVGSLGAAENAVARWREASELEWGNQAPVRQILFDQYRPGDAYPKNRAGGNGVLGLNVFGIGQN
ncbi:hypothetical protein IB278_16170 [Variovorax sp. VRV01]|uniref:hypothetical protein n=1 Tax=Variovorax sp. VRV01 TaxID=2769259 RepID=UPI00177B345B|nr:hypothetical protein [Variovorax sp. VRV01]MBD9665510.1 hypothetical protein [Variovorax sp. VRV01]